MRAVLVLMSAVIAATALLISVVAMSLHRLHQQEAGSPSALAANAAQTNVSSGAPLQTSVTPEHEPSDAHDTPNPPTPNPQPPTHDTVKRTDGSILLSPAAARIHGYKLRLASRPRPLLVDWIDPQEYVEWPSGCPTPGQYEVEITYACAPNAGGEFAVTAAAARVQGRADNTGGWQTFRTAKLGTLTVANPRTAITLRPTGSISHCLLYLRSVRLTPV